MNLAVLTSPESWYFQDLQRAAADRHEICAVSFRRIQTALGGAGVNQFAAGEMDLRRFHALLVRTMSPGSLEQVAFRMDALARLEHSGCVVLNSPRSFETAVDKYLALAKMEAAGLPTPRTIVCQTLDEAMAGFEQLSGDVVLKPLFGSEGRGITRISDADLALRAFKMLEQLNAVIYMQQFIEHQGFDIRVLIIGRRTFAMRRRNDSDWRTNVSRGAITESCEIDNSLVEMARRASDAVGASYAGVDLLPDREGNVYLLEVNAVPGWKALARTLEVDIADCLLKHIESEVESRREAHVS